VRALIVAVRLYTGRAVDVVGFSLGVPVSRKAILGGILIIIFESTFHDVQALGVKVAASIRGKCHSIVHGLVLFQLPARILALR
jgi:hypothetical protein